jgi:hypothetical protein
MRIITRIGVIKNGVYYLKTDIIKQKLGKYIFY